MTKQYTVSEVIELQNQQKQVSQRLEIHKNRANEKRAELQELFKQAGVKDIQELSQVCANTNAQMQSYAAQTEQIVKQMKEQCDALDAML